MISSKSVASYSRFLDFDSKEILTAGNGVERSSGLLDGCLREEILSGLFALAAPPEQVVVKLDNSHNRLVVVYYLLMMASALVSSPRFYHLRHLLENLICFPREFGLNLKSVFLKKKNIQSLLFQAPFASFDRKTLLNVIAGKGEGEVGVCGGTGIVEGENGGVRREGKSEIGLKLDRSIVH